MMMMMMIIIVIIIMIMMTACAPSRHRVRPASATNSSVNVDRVDRGSG